MSTCHRHKATWLAALCVLPLVSHAPSALAQTTFATPPYPSNHDTTDAPRHAQESAPQRIEISRKAPSVLDARPRTTSRLPVTVRETPASISVVDRDTIDAMGALHTHDVLKAVPGVTFSSQPGAAGSAFYRGFGASSLSQLYNGITVQYDAIAARPVDAWIVDRVEAIGGPSSFLHGSGAVGGTINVLTKIADLRGDETHARAMLGTQEQLAASVQRDLGTLAGEGNVFRADLNATRGTHWAMGNNRKTWQASASWRTGLTASLSHTLAVERQHERVAQPYWGTPLLRNSANAVVGEVSIDRRTRDVNYNVLDGKYQQDVTWARSITEWQIAPSTRASHTLYHYDALRDYENVETYGWVNSNTQVQRSNALLQRHDQQVYGSRTEASHGTVIGGLKSDFAAGWDWSYNRQTRFPLSVAGPFDTTDPYAPAATYFYSTPGIVPGFVPGATNQLRTFAAFVENRTVFAPTWALTTGLRMDRIALTVTNHRTATASNPATFSTGFRPMTGRIGLVKELTPAWQVYAQYSTAADPPAGILSTAGFSALRDFDLTRGRQIELGTKGSFDDQRGDVTAAVYKIDRKKLAMTDPNDRTRVIPIGAQSSRGAELTGRWRPMPTLQFAAHLSYVDARFDEFVETVGTTTVSRAGNRPTNVPDWVAGLSSTWRAAAGLAVTLDVRHVGLRYANTANTVWESGYDLLGVGLSYEVARKLTLRARVDNLTDKIYSATVGTNLSVLGAPRTWQLGLDWKF